MKRSNDDDENDNLSRQQLLDLYAQQEKDVAALIAKKEQTTAQVQRMAKEVIIENLGHISPFRDRFLAKLGTIVDFGVSHPTILIESGDRDDCFFFIWVVTEDDVHDTIDVCPVYFEEGGQGTPSEREIREEEGEYLVHRFSISSGKYLQECPDSDCKCNEAMSELDLLLKFVKLHAHTIIALIHEMRQIYHDFMQEPQKLYEKINRCVLAYWEKKNKKHKKDGKK
jgi:hypothetical protein